MANILGRITVNNKEILEVDGIPSALLGTSAPLGSEAMYDDGSVGSVYIKFGTADTDWDKVSTASSGGVGIGTFMRLALYDLSPDGTHVSDSVVQNTNTIDVAVVAQPARSANIQYNIPNPGNAVTSADFVLTEGAQTINGTKTFGNDVIVQGNLTVNGTLTYINTTQLQVTDPLITLNKGGAALSAAGVGFEIEENSAITGYWKTNATRDGWVSLVPASSFTLNLSQAALSANRTQSFADTNGTFVMRPTLTPGVAGQISFFSDANNIISDSGLAWNNTTKTLSVTSFAIPTFTLGSVIFAGAGGVLSQNNAKFFWDNTNGYLGLGNSAPARTLDVSGSAVFHGPVRMADSGAAKANWEKFQAETQTVNATSAAISTVAIPMDSTVVVSAFIQGHRTGGTAGAVGDCASYFRTATFKNVGGTVSIVQLQSDYTYEDQKSWDGSMDINGTNARINVKGAVNNNVDWTVTYDVIVLQ